MMVRLVSYFVFYFRTRNIMFEIKNKGIHLMTFLKHIKKKNTFQRNSILVTGAAGFIGFHLCKLLIGKVLMLLVLII